MKSLSQCYELQRARRKEDFNDLDRLALTSFLTTHLLNGQQQQDGGTSWRVGNV